MPADHNFVVSIAAQDVWKINKRDTGRSDGVMTRSKIGRMNWE